jgi:hypothetical protein
MPTFSSRGLLVCLATGVLAYGQDGDLQVKDSFIHFLRPIIGAGFNVRTEDAVDFKSENNALLTVNDSVFRVAATAGFWVPWSTCGLKWERAKLSETMTNGTPTSDPECYSNASWRGKLIKRSGLLFNIQFTQGGQNTVDGFSAGYGFMIRPGVIIHGSYTRYKGQELSPGFKRAAVAAINESRANYGRFAPYVRPDGSSLTSEKLWDGFPLNVGGQTPTPVFPGQPIIESYNGSVTLGVVIPLDAIMRTGRR